MKRMKCISATFLAISLMTAGCHEDVYDPNKNPSEKDYFNFETRATVALNVDYNAPGYQAYIEVYDQNPITTDENGAYVKKDIQPVYSAFTDKNGKLKADMYIPTAVTEAYLYTTRWGLPMCEKLTAEINGGFKYDATQQQAQPTTRAVPDFQGSVPYDFGYLAKTGIPITSLCKWDINGAVGGNINSGYVTITKEVNNEKVADISDRAMKYIDKLTNKSELLKPADITNITITEDETELDVVIVAERAAYSNVFGYYYYKLGNAPTSRKELHELPKYIIFPNASITPWILPQGSTATLKFFGENYNQAPQDVFPKDYVIGWYYISNGFSQSGNITYLEKTLYDYNPIFFSDDINNFSRFIALNDVKSKIVLLGFEDQQEINNPATEDYSDVVFFVKSSKDIINGRPDIPDPEPVFKTETIAGTLTFEDVWPYGGDYDLNDVAVEYKRIITYDENNYAVKISETFKPIHHVGAAVYDNYFSYQTSNTGNYNTLPDGVVFESETNSFIINKSAKDIIEQSFTIERTFQSGSVKKDNLKTDFNPFIIVKSTPDSQGYPKTNRTEVHLPKYPVTANANQSSINKGDDAFYVDKSGKYPFAIDIATTNFKLSPERVNIGETYPKFNSWAESKGTKDTDWYLYPKQ